MPVIIIAIFSVIIVFSVCCLYNISCFKTLQQVYLLIFCTFIYFCMCNIADACKIKLCGLSSGFFWRIMMIRMIMNYFTGAACKIIRHIYQSTLQSSSEEVHLPLVLHTPYTKVINLKREKAINQSTVAWWHVILSLSLFRFFCSCSFNITYNTTVTRLFNVLQIGEEDTPSHWVSVNVAM